MKTIKIIDLLNKIANGEEDDLITEFEFDKRVWNFKGLNDSEFCLDGWLLNQNIVITKHKEILEEEPRDIKVCGSLLTKSEYDDFLKDVEENKIPEKLDYDTASDDDMLYKINEIIDYLDYLKSKGE